MSATLKAFIDQSQSRINLALGTWLNQPDHGAPELLAAMRYSLLSGGKRIRPLLAYAAAESVGQVSLGTDAAACALEAIHAYSLIHDDLPAMDDDDLRRGQPTCHIAFGEATAILAGDGLQALAFERLATEDSLSAEKRVLLVQQLASASGPTGMVGGQAIDLASVNQQRTLPQLQHMHALKTGALITAAVLMGATSAGADSSQLQALKVYAQAIGLAFQIQDDILDVTADTATLGKPQGADMALNKPTYVSLLGLDGAKEKTQQLLTQALSAIEPFGPSAVHLEALAHYIIEREK